MIKKDVGVVVDWFDDMVAFVELVRSNPTITSSSIVSTLAHDLGGLIRQEKCFSPRTSGYTKHLERRNEGLRQKTENEAKAREKAEEDTGRCSDCCSSTSGCGSGPWARKSTPCPEFIRKAD